MIINRFALLSLLAICTNFSQNSFAQSTCLGATFENFKTCTASGINNCSSQFTQCDSIRSLITLEDVYDLAVAGCCASSSKVVRGNCLVAERRKYQKLTPRFRNAVSNTIRNIELSNCFKGTPTVTPTVTVTATATATATLTATETPTATATVTPTP